MKALLILPTQINIAFKKDVKKMKKRGKSFNVFKQVIQQLAQGELLNEKFRDHKLRGNYTGTRECHIDPPAYL